MKKCMPILLNFLFFPLSSICSADEITILNLSSIKIEPPHITSVASNQSESEPMLIQREAVDGHVTDSLVKPSDGSPSVPTVVWQMRPRDFTADQRIEFSKPFGKINTIAQMRSFIKKNKSTVITKDAFESIDQHRQRISTLSLPYFLLEKPVSDLVQRSKFEYDAERKIVKIPVKIIFDQIATELFTGGLRGKNYLAFTIHKAHLPGKSYTGSNAFGVKAKVTVTNVTREMLVFVNTASGSYGKGAELREAIATFSMEPAAAKKLFDKGVKFKIYGSVIAHEADETAERRLIRSSSRIESPTISEPSETHFNSLAVMAILDKVDVLSSTDGTLLFSVSTY